MATNMDGYVSTDPDVQAKIKSMQAQAIASSSQSAPLSPEDAANAAKYSTPLPPNDPASLRNSRDNQFYIGPTNFSKIQQKYTPYQIEQATTRNAQGDIFWKEGVDINKIPPAPNGTGYLTPPSTIQPLSTDYASSAGVSMSSSGLDTTLGRQQADAAGKYLTGIQSTIDGLLATQQKMLEDQKKEAEAKVGGLMDRLRARLDGSQYKKQLDRDRQMFEIEKNINTLNLIREKLASATSALESGLIYEEGRPVRMALLTGRMSELKKQGIAQINALSSAAEVIKGNIDIARAYADDSLAAIKADNAEKNAALNTLLELENAKLIRLTDAEKDTIESRRKLLEDESARLERDKDAIFDLAVKYPLAFAQGGVSFIDDPATAMQKMSKFMSEREQIELEQERLKIEALKADIADKKKQTLLRGRSTGGGNGSSAGASEISQAIDYLRSKNLSQDQIRTEIYKRYGDKVKGTEIERILDSIFSGVPKTDTTDIHDVLARVKAEEELKAMGRDAQGNPLPKEEKKSWTSLFSWGK